MTIAKKAEDSRTMMEIELGKLPSTLRQLAENLGMQFADTYGIAGYSSTKVFRELDLPADVGRVELARYVQQTWNATYLRDRFACVYCGLDGLASAANYSLISVDHLVPIWPSDSDIWAAVPTGLRIINANGPENLACACRHCNSAKGNRILGLTTSMSRRERIETARAQLGRWRQPHRYDAEVEEVAKLVRANEQLLNNCG